MKLYTRHILITVLLSAGMLAACSQIALIDRGSTAVTASPPPDTIVSEDSTTVEPDLSATRMPTEEPSVTGEPTITVAATAYLTRPPAGQAIHVPILMYHHLNQLGPRASSAERTWTVSPEAFNAQLDYIAQHDFSTITFARLIAFFGKGEPLPLHPIILTFDDGWLDDYTVAFPALTRRGQVGVFFVPTAYADAGGKTLIGWSQMLEMSAAGMEFGGHTINHANLKQATPEEALRQLQASKAKLENRLGIPVLALAYPFGAVDNSVVALVRQSGYKAAVGLCCGYQIKEESMLNLPRIRVSYDDSLEVFARRLPRDDGTATPMPSAGP